MDFDAVLSDVGEFGWYQVLSTLVLWIPTMVGGVHTLMYSFTGLSPKKYRCRIDGCDTEPTFGFQDVPSTIFDSVGGEPNYCKYRKMSQVLSNGSCLFSTDEFTTCSPNDEFVFEKFEFEETFVTEWGLECDSFKVSMVGSVYMFGVLLGAPLFGKAADRFGRKMSLLVSIVVSSLGSLIGAFMPDYYSYLITRVITAVGSQGLFMIPFMIIVEIIGPNSLVPLIPWRMQNKSLIASMTAAPFPVGMALLSIIASYYRNWRTLQWTVSAATLVQIVLWFFMPESPRWLLATGQVNRAKAEIERMAWWNGVKGYTFQPQNYLHQHQMEKEDETDSQVSDKEITKKLGIRDLFHPSLIKISLILMLCWPIVTLGYYGITFSMASLDDNLFLNFILSSLVEIPAFLAVAGLMDVWGRKPLFAFSLICTGGLCIGVGLLEKGVFRTCLAMVGKLCAAGGFCMAYLFTAELFPTSIRSSANGMCSLTARIGGFLAPVIATYLPMVAGPAAPYLVLGGLTLLGGMTALFLPETLGSNLPDTIQDVQGIKAKSSSIWKCGSPTPLRLHSSSDSFSQQ